MFKSNVSTSDRVIRVVVGIVLIAMALLIPDVAWAKAGWIGVVPLATGLLGWCGLYGLLGISTRHRSS